MSYVSIIYSDIPASTTPFGISFLLFSRDFFSVFSSHFSNSDFDLSDLQGNSIICLCRVHVLSQFCLTFNRIYREELILVNMSSLTFTLMSQNANSPFDFTYATCVGIC